MPKSVNPISVETGKASCVHTTSIRTSDTGHSLLVDQSSSATSEAASFLTLGSRQLLIAGALTLSYRFRVEVTMKDPDMNALERKVFRVL